MKLKFLSLALFFLSSTFLYAQDNNQSKLIGGMYVHSGYLSNINDFSYGLGGKISFKLSNCLRIGTEG